MNGITRRPVQRHHLIAVVVALMLAGGMILPSSLSGWLGTTALAQVDRSGLYVLKWDCPASFGGDFGLLTANCTTTSNVIFEVTGLGFYGPQSFQGGFSLSNMPAGVYRIRELIPQGYGEPRVFCGFAAYYEQEPLKSEVITYDGVYEFQLAQDQAIYCYWFNVPLQPKITASGLIRKHGCPAGFDATSADIYELAANCHDALSDIPFTITQLAWTQTVNSDQNGWTRFSNVPPGPLVIGEEVPDGYAIFRVFCNQRKITGESTGYTEMDVSDEGAINLLLQPGYDFDCDWFNAPAQQGVTISVVKYLCPDYVGYDWGDYADYAAECTDAGEGVSFKLDSASTGNPGDQQTDASGQASWSGFEADHYYLTELPEEAPAGYGKPVAFCAYYDPAAMQDRQYDRYDVSDEYRIEFDMADGQFITCTWFNISLSYQGQPEEEPTYVATEEPIEEPTEEPAEEPEETPIDSTATLGSLMIVAYACDAGYDPFATEADPSSDCLDPLDDREFDLTGSDGEASGLTGADGDGTLIFADLAADRYTLQAQLPEDIDQAFVLACLSDIRSFDDYPFYPFAVPDESGSLALTLLDAENLACSWYEVPAPAPADAAVLHVTKEWCPGASVNPASCEPYTEGIELTLSPANGTNEPVSETTDEQGLATFTVPAGTYLLEEEGGIEWCFAVSEAFDADGNLVLDAGTEVEITIYNCGEQP